MKDETVVLITGGCGYLGSQLIRDLGRSVSGNLTIRVLDNMQSGYYQTLMGLPAEGKYQFIEGDILDPAALRLALHGVDIVVHLASVVRTPMGFGDSAQMKQVNQWGTSHLVDACVEAGIERFVYASSTAVYGPGGPFDESVIPRPVGPYAQSVYQAEKIIQAAAPRGLKPTILRFGTIFGLAPTVRFDSVVNRFAYLAGVGRPLTVFGSGQQRRPVVHVRDASAAVLFTLSNSEITVGKLFNVVEENATVLDLVAAIQMIQPSIPVRYTDQDVLTHFSFEAKNTAFIQSGWQPHLTIETGLAELLAQFGNIKGVRPWGESFLQDINSD
ncbi:MAG: SDR family oxidoreductase [Candidatus Promineifilaceae bacterium]